MDTEANLSFAMEIAGETETINVKPTPTPRRRRKKSFVWDYFTVEAVDDGCTRACCKQCKQSYAYSTGSKIAGTSHLKRHILLGICPKIRQERQQLASTPGSKSGASTDPPKRRYRRSAIFSSTFDQERCCVDLAKMIIMHEYQLHMVEHPAFAAFVHVLQPRFKIPDLDTIESEIMNVYHKEKQSVSLLFGSMPGRVSLTISLWTTTQSLGYVCLTAHFVDNEWKLHRRMLNFMMVSSPHSENALSDAIGYSLTDWSMKNKLFTITLDNNCSSHDIYSANLRDYLSNKSTLMLKGQLFVVRCYAHVLNVVAQDVIASIHGIVYNIRESVKYVKASVAREEKFVEIAQQLQIPSTKTLCLDVQMQWNTTYHMLVGALDFRPAFACLETCDANYNEAPSTEDWRKIEIVCTYLKLLYDSANVIMGTAEATANIFFHEAWKIQLELTNAAQNEDSMVRSIARDMHEKFDKYWKDCSLVLAIAVVMDPRFKMKLVEFSFAKIYAEDAARYIKVIDDAIHELYLEYASQPLSLTPAYTEYHGDANNIDVSHFEANNVDAVHIYATHMEMGNIGEAKMEATDVEASNTEASNIGMGELEANNIEANNIEATMADDMQIVEARNAENTAGHCTRPIPTFSIGHGLLDFDIYISETSVNCQTKSELEQYFEESLVPRIQEFDILNWWKLNTLKYPTLCRMARDVLAIPMSMMSSFGTGSGSRMLDEYQSSLQPEIVEALFCAKDWLQYQPTMTEAPSNAIVKMEF